MSTTPLTPARIKAAPKVLLHDHLDGGLRPVTILELAREIGYTALPTSDPDELAKWFVADAPGSDLVRYLEGFAHTTAVMQTKDQIERVASETAFDLALDGVVYAEIRFAPELHVERGLSLDEVVEALVHYFDEDESHWRLSPRSTITRLRLVATPLDWVSQTPDAITIEAADAVRLTMLPQ